MGKKIVCACEDVTEGDLEAAVQRGYCDLESVKRYTGFGTGFCQGKSCLSGVSAWLERTAPQPAGGLAPFTPRPPLAPTALAALASLDPALLGPPGPGIPPLEALPFSPTRHTDRLPERCQVAIIGGGIMGLALAYNLAKRGQTDVVVLEAGYLCAGASGRNGGGVRMQWNTATNIRLARRSIELCRSFARELGVNVWLRQGGYLFLAESAEVARRLERSAEFHRRHDVPTRLLTPDGAREIVPELDAAPFAIAAFNPRDGVVFPWPFLWGYANRAVERGVRVETFTRVVGVEVERGRVRAVQTDRGRLACDILVNAAGAWSPSVATLAGVALPNQPHRHEILVTEPLKPFLGPLVSVLDHGLYFSQSMRGEIVGGMGDSREPASLESGATLGFLARFSRAILRAVPRLGAIQVVRQWAGSYDVTPDNSPILGETPGVKGFLQMSGFVGHGFMMAPAVAELMADWMTGGERDEIFDRFGLGRFAEGRLEREDFIIG
ncbi:MAG: FAD-dependent oxidoreductase [Deltaproteobacteria bacterium]